MIRPFPALVLIAACATDASDPTNTMTGPQDLSGYATAADLAALQEQLDAQAAELDELRAQLDEGMDDGEGVLVYEYEGCPESNETRSYARFGFTEPIFVISAAACQPQPLEGGGVNMFCSGGLESDNVGIGAFIVETDPDDTDGDGYVSRVTVYCDSSTDVVYITYLPG